MNERAILLATLKTEVANAGLTGNALQEVYERLEATDTEVLREAVQTGAVALALRLAGTDNSTSPDSKKDSEGAESKHGTS